MNGITVRLQCALLVGYTQKGGNVIGLKMQLKNEIKECWKRVHADANHVYLRPECPTVWDLGNGLWNMLHIQVSPRYKGYVKFGWSP